MERVWKCACFTLARLWTFCLFYIAIYFAFACGLPTLLAVLNRGANVSTVGSGMWIFSCVYLLVSCMVFYGRLFNNLLLYSNTRGAAFGGITLALVLNGAALAVFSPAADALTGAVARAVNYRFHNPILYLYPHARLSALIPLYFSLGAAILGSALLYSALLYKFGKKMHIVFWPCVILLVNVGSALLSANGAGSDSQGVTLLYNYFGIGGHPGTGTWHLLLTGAALGGIAWLLARRQPLRA